MIHLEWLVCAVCQWLWNLYVCCGVPNLSFKCMDLKLKMYETRSPRGCVISWVQGRVWGCVKW